MSKRALRVAIFSFSLACLLSRKTLVRWHLCLSIRSSWRLVPRPFPKLPRSAPFFWTCSNELAKTTRCTRPEPAHSTSRPHSIPWGAIPATRVTARWKKHGSTDRLGAGRHAWETTHNSGFSTRAQPTMTNLTAISPSGSRWCECGFLAGCRKLRIIPDSNCDREVGGCGPGMHSAFSRRQ